MPPFQIRDNIRHEELQVTVSDSLGPPHVMSIPKGFITLAAKEEATVNLATCGKYDMYLQKNDRQHVFLISEKGAGETACTMKVDGMFVDVKCADRIKVHGLRALALHVRKKGLLVPRSVAALAALPPYLCCDAAMHTIRGMQYDVSCATPSLDSHSYYLMDAYREVNFFNAKFVSLVNSIYTGYDLRQSQGVCLNVCTAYTTPSRAATALLAHTLEPVQLPAAMVADLQEVAAGAKPVCSVRFLQTPESKTVTSMAVFKVPVAVREQLAAQGVSVREVLSTRTLFALSESRVPILIVDACPAEAADSGAADVGDDQY